MPTARARSFGSRKVLTMIDIATGLSIAPPTACNARAATSTRAFGATLQSNEPILKTNSPAWNVLRRPKRSAIEPASSRKLATTMV